MFEAELTDLPEGARSAVSDLLDNPPAAASAPGGDREWYRLTTHGEGGEKTLSIASADMPEALATLPRPSIPE